MTYNQSRCSAIIWHSRTDSVLAVIKINALQVMYSGDALKPPALPYCFGTKVKQEDTALVQIQEITGLLGGSITSTLVALASVRQQLQWAATELEDLTTDIVLTFKELYGPASTQLGHALRLVASSFNSLLKK